jgi:hypothetical protein
MSIIRSNNLTLEEIIASSNLVVEVEAVEPYEEHIPIAPDSETPLPDFIKRGIVFRVKRILKNTSGDSIPTMIKVPNENWKRSLSQHKEQNANGPSKSFTYKKYASSVSIMSDAKILFLNHHRDDFSLTAHNAFESLDALKIIEEIIQ